MKINRLAAMAAFSIYPMPLSSIVRESFRNPKSTNAPRPATKQYNWPKNFDGDASVMTRQRLRADARNANKRLYRRVRDARKVKVNGAFINRFAQEA